MNKKRYLLAVAMFLLPISCFANDTNRGKIYFTQGHYVSHCRTVGFKDNTTGENLAFRIDSDEGSNDIQAVVLAALMSNRDVTIHYDPSITTGCGTEPKILYVTIW